MTLDDGPHASIYAKPRRALALHDCHFYHTIDIPGHGVAHGDWDLRTGIDSYLGHLDVVGRRVLDLGTADGFLTFHLEQRGASVVSFDLSEDHCWDVVPYARTTRNVSPRDGDWVIDREHFQKMMRRVNNAYWFCHQAFSSTARMVYGEIYSLPAAIGHVDISLFGAILMHTRDPFRALERATALTRETVVVTEPRGRTAIPPYLRWPRRILPRRLARPTMQFLPDWRMGEGADGWWRLSPELVQSFLGVLGFSRSTVHYHSQLFHERKRKLFTVVAHRTVPLSAVPGGDVPPRT